MKENNSELMVDRRWQIMFKLSKHKDYKQLSAPVARPMFFNYGPWIGLIIALFLTSCSIPDERIVLKGVRDVVVDATSEPTLKANAFFYNPNNTRMKLKRINVEVFLKGKKVAVVDQKLALLIPAKGEFSIPLEVKLAIKEFGFVDTLLGMIGGNKMPIQYKGHLKLTYHGFPIRVPVDYKDEIRLNF